MHIWSHDRKCRAVYQIFELSQKLSDWLYEAHPLDSLLYRVRDERLLQINQIERPYRCSPP